ncbi:MAG TPA: ABC transporter ATP-binding protein [Thermoanaerobaculia bacterium]|nr:ABC transporter ATP-binding protein [Thermoanaerobaculia bacterium]
MQSVSMSFTGLTRRFGRVRALSSATAEVAGGGVLVVTGSNGAGKSTLLRCLAGLLAPDSGRIEHVEDGRALPPEERRLRIGWVAPDLAFYDELTTLENLTFFAKLRGLPPRRGVELLERVGLPADRDAGALSSGMRQRLRWAWALLHRPRALLLDEPFQNLDSEGEATARALVAEHLAAGGLAVIASPVPLEVDGVVCHLELAR